MFIILPWIVLKIGQFFLRAADILGNLVIGLVISLLKFLVRLSPPVIRWAMWFGKNYVKYSRRFFVWLGTKAYEIDLKNRVKKVNWKLGWSFKFPKLTARLPNFQKQKVYQQVVVKKTKKTKTPQVMEVYVAPKRNWGRRIALFGLIGFVALVIYSVALVRFVHDLPTPDRLTSIATPSTTEFYDRNGKLLYRLYEGRNRSKVNLDELPKYMIDATIAIEDKHFYQHRGIDFFGIARSIYVYARERQVQGGSTLTQQLIKNTLLTSDRTFERKIKEVFLALWTETVYNKDEILQMYFNEVPYGGPAWGIEAAAQTYFGKSAKDLTLAEAAYLAGLPASPTVYSWFGTNPELGMQRQQQVLRRMLEDGKISESDYRIASSEKLQFAAVPNSIKAPHFVMWLRQNLAQKYGEKTVSQGGLKVYTTLDLDLQQKAEQIVADEVSKLSYLRVSNGAAMITDARTGGVLAMVGSKDYYANDGGNFNVTTATRQPGSSIKPITYVTGFKLGYSPGNVMLDIPTSFKNAWETYTPVNYDGKFHGPVSIRQALGSSYNIPAVKMLALVGIDNMVQTARDMGITTFNDLSRFGLSLTLGGGEVKMVDMMSAYGTFASGGVRHNTTGIVKVVDSSGVTLEDSSDNSGVRVLSPGVSYMISSVLSDNGARTPAFGPNSLLNIPGHTVAVKTGTTDLKRDNWTFGYTPDYVVGVWVGNNNNLPMDPALSSGVTGAAPIWNRIMTEVLRDKPNVAFERPGEVADMTIDGKKDLGILGLSNKSAVKVVKTKDDKEPTKDVVTFTDPFSKQAETPGKP